MVTSSNCCQATNSSTNLQVRRAPAEQLSLPPRRTTAEEHPLQVPGNALLLGLHKTHENLATSHQPTLCGYIGQLTLMPFRSVGVDEQIAGVHCQLARSTQGRWWLNLYLVCLLGLVPSACA